MNPNVKAGEMIVVKKDNGSGCAPIVGAIVKVVSVVKGTIIVEADAEYGGHGGPGSRKWTVYRTDEYILANRKSQAAYHLGRVKEYDAMAKSEQREADRLLKYETDEEEVAAKLVAINNAGSDSKKIAEILKTLKQSHYL